MVEKPSVWCNILVLITATFFIFYTDTAQKVTTKTYLKIEWLIETQDTKFQHGSCPFANLHCSGNLFTFNEYTNCPFMLILTFQNITGLLPCHLQVSFADFSQESQIFYSKRKSRDHLVQFSTFRQEGKVLIFSSLEGTTLNDMTKVHC